NTEKWADKLAKAARTGYFAINSAKFSGIFNLLRGCGKLIGASLARDENCPSQMIRPQKR
ncbi:hypothetical protein, partial [Pseudomonas fragi]|uniref:hypothetical protein n=1 Tax=Pseudomonas fragi TaxID=296 RepID=UPI001CA38ADC